MSRLLPLLALVLLVFSGCSSGDPGKKPEPVEKNGTLKLNGAPLTDVVVNLQPTTPNCHPVAATVTDGKFKVTVIPGTYLFFITQGKLPASYKGVPQEYREASLERDELVVASGDSTIDISIE